MKIRIKAIILAIILNSFVFVSSQRTNYQRPLNKPAIYKNAPRRSTVHKSKDTDVKQRLRCIQSYSRIADPVDLYSYKICIPNGGNWIVYSYKCPSRTYFNEHIRRCVTGTPDIQIENISTTSKSTENVIPSSGTSTVSAKVEKTSVSTLSSNLSDGSQTSIFPGSTSAIKTSTFVITGMEETTISSTNSSSSSSEESTEIFLTHPSHFTNKPPPSHHTITGQLSIPNFIENYYQPQGFPYDMAVTPLIESTQKYIPKFTTNKPSKPHKLTTWQSLNKIPASTLEKSMMPPLDVQSLERDPTASGDKLPPLEFFSSLNTFDEKIFQNLIAATDQYATRKPIQWNPKIIGSALHTRERFPGLRPSLQA